MDPANTQRAKEIVLSRIPIFATELKGNVYQIVDAIIETGIPVGITRKGKRLRLEQLVSD